MKRVIFGIVISVVSVLCADAAPGLPQLTNFTSHSLPEMNALFEQTNGWLGADGVYSVALSPERTLWLFDDTWVGSVRDGKRADATMINNSVAIQEGYREKSKLNFSFGRGDNGKAASLITPADGRGWFWPQAGVLIGKRLYVFLSQIEKNGKPGVFGFRYVGQSLGIISNPNEDPASWKVEQRKLPFSFFSAQRELAFGAAVLLQDDYLYVFGTDNNLQDAYRSRQMILARVPPATVEDFSTWRFYVDGRWETNPTNASHLVDHIAAECSVSYLPALTQYVLVYTDNGLSPHILARTAAAPWGPWSDATIVYTCPEMARDKRIFCYAAKAHSSQGSNDELVLSYVANSFDFWQVVADARLYWPRFVSVKVGVRQ